MDRMKVIYVAGPYRAKTEWGLVQNIRHAEQASIKLWREGWAVICPHKNTSFLGGAVHDGDDGDSSIWLDGDLEILRRCDAIFMLNGWTNSEGARKEFELACELRLGVFFEIIHLHKLTL